MTKLMSARPPYLMIVTAITLCGCLGAPHHVPPTDTPDAWLSQFDPAVDRCADIDSTFHNRGERYLGMGRVANDGLLAEMVLSQYLPGGRTSESLEITANEQNGSVEAVLVGPSTTKVSFPIYCESGWYVLKSTRGRTYLGEGIEQDSYEKLTFFRIGQGGELIAKVMEQGTYTSHYLFTSGASSEWWYRFSPLVRPKD